MQSEIKTKNIYLNLVTADDSLNLLQLRTNAEVAQFIKSDLTFNLNDILKLIQRLRSNPDVEQFYVIRTDPDSAFAGTICLWRMDQQKKYAEIGYELLPEFQNKGIMSAAIQAITKYGFQELGLKTIEAFTNKNNVNSRKLLAKCGFKLLADRTDPGFPDNTIYELTR